MIWRLFDELFRRPWAALASSVEILGNRMPTKLKVEAAMSRMLHAIGRGVMSNPGRRSPETGDRSNPG